LRDKAKTRRMDVESRLRMYMGPLYDRHVLVSLNDIRKEGAIEYRYDAFRGHKFPDDRKSYYHDLTRYLHAHPALHRTTYLFYPHDRVEGFSIPTLVKSRSLIDSQMSVLCNLNTIRHFMPLYDVRRHDVPFDKKQNKLVWRGADTGPGFGNNIPHRECSRETLVREYTHSTNPNIDIGLTKINSNQYTDQSEYEAFLRPPMDMKELLRYRFLLSVEGNDVASNLKWILTSNSVPFCPPFTIQSWILEDQLIPWTHYIPVRADFADMEERIEWAIHHPDACRRIAEAGQEYMNPFLDIREEDRIMTELLRRYAQNVRIQK